MHIAWRMFKEFKHSKINCEATIVRLIFSPIGSVDHVILANTSLALKMIEKKCLISSYAQVVTSCVFSVKLHLQHLPSMNSILVR